MVAEVGYGLVVATAALPTVLTWLANLRLRKIPGYRGRVRRVSIDFIAPSLVVRDLSFVKLNGSRVEQILDLRSVIVGSEWKKIFSRAFDGYVRIDSPRLLLDLEGIRRAGEEGTTKSKLDRDSEADDDRQPWQERVKKLPAFRLSSAVLTDGEVH